MATDKDKIFEVDESSDLPIWVQLRNRITYLIRTGYFKSGDQLPSVRSVAADAGINYNTVTKAYRDLEFAKLIVSVRGRGMYVQDNPEPFEENDLGATDAVLLNCIEEYRLLGMNFAEIREHINEIAEKMEDASISAANERMRHREAQ